MTVTYGISHLQPGCAAFTFVKDWDLNCFLKSERGEESEFVGAISGTLTPCTDLDRERPRQSLTGRKEPNLCFQFIF